MKSKQKRTNGNPKFNDAIRTPSNRCCHQDCPHLHGLGPAEATISQSDYCGVDFEFLDHDPYNAARSMCSAACLRTAPDKPKRQRPLKVQYRHEQYNDACLVFDHYLRFLDDMARATRSEDLQRRIREIETAKTVVEALFFAQHGEALPTGMVKKGRTA